MVLVKICVAVSSNSRIWDDGSTITRCRLNLGFFFGDVHDTQDMKPYEEPDQQSLPRPHMSGCILVYTRCGCGVGCDHLWKYSAF